MRRGLACVVALLFTVPCFAEEPKYYATVFAAQSVPQRLVAKVESIGRTAINSMDGRPEFTIYKGTPDKDGMVRCSVSGLFRTPIEVSALTKNLSVLAAALDGLPESTGFAAGIQIYREPPRR